jgi:hypothetical protein
LAYTLGAMNPEFALADVVTAEDTGKQSVLDKVSQDSTLALAMLFATKPVLILPIARSLSRKYKLSLTRWQSGHSLLLVERVEASALSSSQ